MHIAVDIQRYMCSCGCENFCIWVNSHLHVCMQESPGWGPTWQRGRTGLHGFVIWPAHTHLGICVSQHSKVNK